MYSQNKNEIRGFSLIELGIVLVVASVIVAGILVGTTMVSDTKMKTVMSDTSSFAESFAKFEKVYGSIPGDMPNATSFFPGVTNGNGNGVIDSNEALLVWQHLSGSGLIEGKYDGSTLTPGEGLPKSAIEGSGYAVSDIADIGIVFELTGYRGGVGGFAAISAGDALALDERYDDGDPDTGKIRAIDGSDTPAQCVSASDYTLAFGDVPTCQLRIALASSAQNESQAQDIDVACGTIGDTRTSTTSTCPTGYVGSITETCTRAGTWQQSHFNCVPFNCGGGIYGDTRTIGCPAGYDGSQTQTCVFAWQVTTDNCAPNADACTDGSLRTLPCPDGQTGSIEQSCSSSTWATTADTCTAVSCGGSNVGDTQFAACPAGFTGVNGITQVCSLNGSWENVANDCVADEGACAPVGNTQTLSCPEGEEGQIEQLCVAGTPDTWKTTSDTCSPVTCGGMPIGFARESTTPCPDGYIGTQFEVCTDSGEWVLNGDNCTLDNSSTGSSSCTAGATASVDLSDPHSGVASSNFRDQAVTKTSDGRLFNFSIVHNTRQFYGRFFEADGTPSGDEFLITTMASGAYRNPRVTELSNGKFAVVIEDGSSFTDGSDSAILAMVLNSDGTLDVAPAQVNTTTADKQAYPYVGAYGSSGNFMVIWMCEGVDGDGTGMCAQKYDSTGATIGTEFVVNTTTAGDQSTYWYQRHNILELNDGGLVVAWADGSPGATYKYQRFDSSGSTSGSETSLGLSQEVDWVQAEDGTFYLATAYWAGADEFDIYVEHRDTDFTTILHDNDAVVQVTTGKQNEVQVDVTSDGNVWVMWKEGDTWTTAFRVLDSELTPVADVVQLGLRGGTYVNTQDPIMVTAGNYASMFWEEDGNVGTYTTYYYNDCCGVSNLTDSGDFQVNVVNFSDDENSASAFPLSDGNYVVLFSSGWGENANFARVVDSSGNEVVAEWKINSSDYALAPYGIDLGNDKFLVVWDQDNNDIKGRVYNYDGTADSAEFTVNASGDGWFDNLGAGGGYGTHFQGIKPLDLLTNGKVIVVFQSSSYDATGQILDVSTSPPTPVGSPFELDTSSSNVSSLSVVALQNGNFMAAWADGWQPSIKNRIFDPSTNPPTAVTAEADTIAAPFPATFDKPIMPVVLENGNVVIAFHAESTEGGTDGDGEAVWLQFLAQDGTNLGLSRLNSTTTGNQSFPVICPLADGGFVGMWSSVNQADDSSGYGVFAQTFNSDYKRIGGEFLVNDYVTNHQVSSYIACGAGGDKTMLAVWIDGDGQDGSGSGVYAKGYGGMCSIDNGTVETSTCPDGTETILNPYTEGDQWNPVLRRLTDDSLAVGFMHYDWWGELIHGSKFSENGVDIGIPFHLANGPDYRGNEYRIIPLNDEMMVVAWSGWDLDGDNHGAMARVVNADLTSRSSSSFQVNTSTGGIQANMNGAVLNDDNDFVLVYYSENYIRFQRFDVDGNKIGSETTVDNGCCGVGMGGVEKLANGNFLVVWSRDDGSWGNHDIYGRIYDPNGIAVTSAFMVNTNTAQHQSFSGEWGEYSHIRPLARLSNDQVVVIWSSKGQDGSNQGVYGQILDVSSSPPSKVGSEFRVNTETANIQERGTVAAFDDGGFVVVWQSQAQDGSGFGIYAQRYDNSGSTVGTETQINDTTAGNQQNPTVETLANGDYIVGWESQNVDGDGYAAVVKVIGNNCSSPTSASYTLPYTTNLAAWFDAADTDTITIGSTNHVAEWENKAAGGENAFYDESANYQPGTGISTRNGNNVLDFDGDDYLYVANYAAIDTSTDISMFVVFHPTTDDIDSSANSYTQGLISKLSGASEKQYTMDFSGYGHIVKVDYENGGNGGSVQSTNYSQLGDYYIFSATIGSGANPDIYLYQNGTQVAFDNTLPATQNLSKRLHIGNWGGSYFNRHLTDGNIAEILIYNEEMATADRESVECYLSDKWAIPVSGCSGDGGTPGSGGSCVTDSFTIDTQEYAGNILFDTGLPVTAGDTVTVTADPADTYYTDGGPATHDADGTGGACGTCFRTALPQGELFTGVYGPPHQVVGTGLSGSFTASYTGVIMLGVNDQLNSLANNSGTVDVSVKVCP